MPDMTRRLRLIGLLALVAAAAGCGGSEEREAAPAPAPAAAPRVVLPDGFDRVDGRDWAIGVPAGFAATPVTAAERRTLTLLSAPEGAAGLPGQVAVARNRMAPGPFDASIEVFKALKLDARVERARGLPVARHRQLAGQPGRPLGARQGQRLALLGGHRRGLEAAGTAIAESLPLTRSNPSGGATCGAAAGAGARGGSASAAPQPAAAATGARRPSRRRLRVMSGTRSSTCTSPSPGRRCLPVVRWLELVVSPAPPTTTRSTSWRSELLSKS